MVMTLGKHFYGPLKSWGPPPPHTPPRRVRRLLVLYEIADLGAVVVRSQGLVEAASVGHGALHVTHLVRGPPEPPGDLLVGGLALELGQELVVGARHLTNLLTHVYRH